MDPSLVGLLPWVLLAKAARDDKKKGTQKRKRSAFVCAHSSFLIIRVHHLVV